MAADEGGGAISPCFPPESPLIKGWFRRLYHLFISASLYGEMKRYKESEKMFRKALKLNPQYTEAYFNLGELLAQQGMM